MAPNDYFFHSSEFLLVCPPVFQKFVFHMPYGVFILKKLSTLDTCYFKAAEAINPEPK